MLESGTALHELVNTLSSEMAKMNHCIKNNCCKTKECHHVGRLAVSLGKMDEAFETFLKGVDNV